MSVADNGVCYVELVTPDVPALSELYSAVYDWRFEPVPELGNAVVARLPDGSRFGIRSPLHAEEKPTVRTYLEVDDIDAAAAEAERLGAVIALPPTEIPGQGKVAICIHGGIEQGLWQTD